jgi:hypothetical protein
MQDATDYSDDDTRAEFPPALDYATSAHRELLIREQSAALVRRISQVHLQGPQLYAHSLSGAMRAAQKVHRISRRLANKA